jgi:hypothetical protein
LRGNQKNIAEGLTVPERICIASGTDWQKFSGVTDGTVTP